MREAEHGKRALEPSRRWPVSHAWCSLDLMMPIMSGPELLQVLQETHRLASLPVKALTWSCPVSLRNVRRFLLTSGLVALADASCVTEVVAAAEADVAHAHDGKHCECDCVRSMRPDWMRA